MQRVRRAVLPALAAAGLAACSSGGGDTEAKAAAPPPRSGTVLVMDGGSRATAPAAVLGFVHGMNAIVLDGDRVFAGMTPLDASRESSGARTLTLANGLTAQLVPADKGFELRFSDGATIALREQEGR